MERTNPTTIFSITNEKPGHRNSLISREEVGRRPPSTLLCRPSLHHANCVSCTDAYYCPRIKCPLDPHPDPCVALYANTICISQHAAREDASYIFAQIYICIRSLREMLLPYTVTNTIIVTPA